MDIGATSPLSAKSDERNTSLGDQLNRMSGIQTEKNLYEEKSKLDKDSFLKMFMEQLKNQDPLNPVNNEQFSQQMAMFSQLEQQISMNKNLEKLVSAQNNTQLAALQLVGKNISADSGAIYHDKNKFSSINFKLPTDVSELKVDIVDSAGQVAKSYKLGPRNQGENSWRWDGLLENEQPAESGRYSYKISGKGMDGKDVTINTKIDGRVTGVTSSHGTVFLLVGDQRVNLNEVETIKDPNAKDTGPAVSDSVAAFNAAQGGAKPTGDANANAKGGETSSEGPLAMGANAPQSQNSETSDNSSSGTKSETEKREGTDEAKASSGSNEGSLFNEATLNGLMPLSLR